MVFSASTVVSAELYGSQTSIFTRQLLFVLLGLVGLMVSMKIDYHFYEQRTVIYSLLILSLALLGFLFWAPGSGGVQRWIRVGPANFQPSELAKLAVILFTSFYLVTRKEEFHNFKRGLLPYLAVVGSIVGLVLLRYRYLLGMILAGIPALYFLVVRVPYRLDRFLAYLYPERDPYGIGYQIRQSLISVGSGGWSGLGYAEGKQKLFFLPEPHTDFIFAVVGEELGLLGCFAVVVLFGLFFWRAARISVRAQSPFGTYLGLGIACMIILQAFVNMSMVVSLLPTKGLPLPFVSVGGSSMIMTMTAVGILLNISSHGRGHTTPRSHP
jgi:cell division protein FtsW